MVRLVRLVQLMLVGPLRLLRRAGALWRPVGWALAGATLLGTLVVTGATGGGTEVAGLAGVAPPPAPVSLPTGVLSGFEADASDGAGMPGGVNDATCRVTSAHPYPVVLVHGTFADANFSWQTLAPMLEGDSYCVFALNYGATSFTTEFGNHVYAIDYVENSAAQLAWFVNQVLAETSATAVDLVGHSQGGMMPRYFIEHRWNCSPGAVTVNAEGESRCAQASDSDTAEPQGASQTHMLVGLAPSNHGADAYGVVPLFEKLFGANTWTFPEQAGCGACGEQEAGNPFLTDLNAADGTREATPGVLYYVIESAYDEVVTPAPNPAVLALGEWPSAYLHGPSTQVVNELLQDQCPTDFTEHLGIIYDPVALQDVVAALGDNGSSVVALPQPACPAVVLPLVSG